MNSSKWEILKWCLASLRWCHWTEIYFALHSFFCLFIWIYFHDLFISNCLKMIWFVFPFSVRSFFVSIFSRLGFSSCAAIILRRYLFFQSIYRLQFEFRPSIFLDCCRLWVSHLAWRLKNSFDVNLKTVPPWSTSNWSHTDLNRLKEGRVSAQVSVK